MLVSIETKGEPLGLPGPPLSFPSPNDDNASIPPHPFVCPLIGTVYSSGSDTRESYTLGTTAVADLVL